MLLAVAAVVFLVAVRPTLAATSDSDVFRDRVIEGPTPATASATPSSATGYPVAGGGTVMVEVDPAYAGTDALQRILDTLGATVHGAEMSRLTVHIADSTNLFRLCA